MCRMPYELEEVVIATFTWMGKYQCDDTPAGWWMGIEISDGGNFGFDNYDKSVLLT